MDLKTILEHYWNGPLLSATHKLVWFFNDEYLPDFEPGDTE
jgi:hypothetical protein